MITREFFALFFAALYFVGMFWYTERRFDDEDDDFIDIAVESILTAFWPLTLILDWLFDVKY